MPIPPANMAPTVTKLDVDSAAIPLMPCPEVQPPAILAPKTRATPPMTALAGEICTVSSSTFKPKPFLRPQLQPNMPRTKITGLGEGHGESLLDDSPTIRQMYCPILS